MGGTSYIVGENGPEMFTPNTTGSITRNGDLGRGGNVNVTFTINAIDTSDFDTLITQRQGTIKQIISDAMLERGQRSTM
jgi:phage-related minor tail protein